MSDQSPDNIQVLTNQVKAGKKGGAHPAPPLILAGLPGVSSPMCCAVPGP
jgi:hypothetical protein